MAATVKAYCATGATPTLATCDSADAGSVRYGRDDAQTSTTAVPIPTATGTKYSYLKYLCLYVTATSTTSLSNRRIAWASAPTTGLTGDFLNQPTYTQNNGTQGTAAGDYPADNATTNGAVPSGFTGMTTSNQVWDNTSVATSATGRNGNYAETVIGVDNTWAGGAGAATLPNVALTYDEA